MSNHHTFWVACIHEKGVRKFDCITIVVVVTRESLVETLIGHSHRHGRTPKTIQASLYSSYNEGGF